MKITVHFISFDEEQASFFSVLLLDYFNKRLISALLICCIYNVSTIVC